MNILLALIKNDCKIFLKDWKALILILIMPFLFIGFFSLSLSSYLNKSNFIDPFEVALVDHENSSQTRIITNQLKEVELFKKILYVREDEAVKLLYNNKIAAIIIIPKDFSESILVGKLNPVVVIGNKSMPLQAFVVKTFIESAANLFSSAQSALRTISYFCNKLGLNLNVYQESIVDLTMRVLSRNEIYSEVTDMANYNLSPMEYYTASLTVIFLMFAGMPGMKMQVYEKCTGITKRLLSTTTKLWHIVLSKTIVSFLLSVLQFTVIIILTSFVFKDYWGAPVSSIIILFLCIIFAISAWSILVASISNTPKTADVLGNLGILLMAIIGGNIYSLSTMPDFVRILSNFTISRHAMEGFMVLFSSDPSLSIAWSSGSLILIGMVEMLLSIIIGTAKK